MFAAGIDGSNGRRTVAVPQSNTKVPPMLFETAQNTERRPGRRSAVGSGIALCAVMEYTGCSCESEAQFLYGACFHLPHFCFFLKFH